MIGERRGRRKTKLGDPLTARQEEVLAAIRRHQMRYGSPPTIREIARSIGLTNMNGVVCHLRALMAKGSIRKAMDNCARIYLPVVPGDCCPTCGRPIEAKGEG